MKGGAVIYHESIKRSILMASRAGASYSRPAATTTIHLLKRRRHHQEVPLKLSNCFIIRFSSNCRTKGGQLNC